MFLVPSYSPNLGQDITITVRQILQIYHLVASNVLHLRPSQTVSNLGCPA